MKLRFLAEKNQKETVEMKISVIKNSLGGFNKRLDTLKQKINELKDRS